MLRNLKVPHKSSEIFSVILPIFKVSMNLAHIKCLSMLLGALCAVQTVCLSKLAGAFDSKASRESCFRRIQRFMSQMVLDLDAVAGYLKSRIPSDGPYTLTMDRTNWKFGEVNINALVLGIAYDHMSFPILFRLLPKRGNSNCKERINIMQRFIRLFGRDSIKCLVADREFVGNEWFKWAQRQRYPVPYPHPRQLLGGRPKNQQKYTGPAHLRQSQTWRGTRPVSYLSYLWRTLLSVRCRYQGQDRKARTADPRFLLPPGGSPPGI